MTRNDRSEPLEEGGPLTREIFSFESSSVKQIRAPWKAMGTLLETRMDLDSRRCARGGWWARRDSNPGPRDYESPALTAELRAPRADSNTGLSREAGDQGTLLSSAREDGEASSSAFNSFSSSLRVASPSSLKRNGCRQPRVAHMGNSISTLFRTVVLPT